MVTWRIVPQIEKERVQGQTIEKIVPCKSLKYRPNHNFQTSEVTFHPLGFVCLQVIIEGTNGETLRLKWSNSEQVSEWKRRRPTKRNNGYQPHLNEQGEHLRGEHKAEPLKGKFAIQQPDTEEYQTFKVGAGKSKRKPWDSKKAVVDYLAPKKKKIGAREVFDSPQDFGLKLMPLIGPEMLVAIFKHFKARVDEMQMKADAAREKYNAKMEAKRIEYLGLIAARKERAEAA